MLTWRNRLLRVAEEAKAEGACVYFLWGTDYEDQPIVNAANKDAACPELQSRWGQHVKSQGGGHGQ